ncbi:dipeptide ABC transporter ATP-binding protein [Streptomyces sp. NPDC051018]|uniref:dipeptide ABC transporter ATP-binding protein n=1 Tax=Streptomyces sp. NPDC051018 TaxID=3365639 RepID=UPI003788BD02
MTGPDEPLLRVRDLSITFDTGREKSQAVRGVSFDVAPGEFVGMVGESGCGKSVTSRALIGLVDKPGRTTGGSVVFEGRDILAMDPAALRSVRGRRICTVFQDPVASLNPVFTVGQQLALVMLTHSTPGGTARAEQLLRDVEIPAAAKRLRQYPHELSGGMRQRVMIAMALANDPVLLIADEPTTALDVTVQAQILELLQRINQDRDMAVLFISHSLDVIADVADRVLVLYAGRLVEQGPTAEVFAAPAHPYTRALLASVPRADGTPLTALPGPAAARLRLHGPLLGAFRSLRHRPGPHLPYRRPHRGLLDPARRAPTPFRRTRSSPCRLTHPPPETSTENSTADSAGTGGDLLKPGGNDSRELLKPGGNSSGELLKPGGNDSGELLGLDGVERHFRTGYGDVRAVDGVSLTVGRREAVGLVGESGSGKSTLGRIALRLEDVSAGSIRFDGDDITRLRGERLRLLRSRFQMVFQAPVATLDPRMRVGDLIAEPLRELLGLGAAERRARAAELLDLVRLPPHLADRYPRQLSGGQAQRVGITRALGPGPDLLVADEPVASLDASAGAQIISLLAELRAERGVSFLFISHDLGVVRHLCDRVAVMYLGRIVETAPTETLYRRPRHPYTKALLSATPGAGGLRERIVLRGEVPDPTDIPTGCRFRTRCPVGPLTHPERTLCEEAEPPLTAGPDGGSVACHFPHDDHHTAPVR